MANSLTNAPSETNEKRVTQSGEIVFEGVSKSFTAESVPAVDDVSFRVAAGDLVVLLGPSGCGKTTLMKMVNRLYEPSQGKIWLGGEEIHTLPINDLRRQIGYVIQQVGLFPHMTIGKNISVVPRLLGWDENRTQKRVEELLELIGLPSSYLSRYPRQLSGGEQQRVGLARALAADPDILLMDEPFAAVDAINRERLQGELLGLHCKLNKTILFVTHDVEEAFRLADKIIVMRAGKLEQYGTPIEIVTQPANEFIEELVGTNNILRRLSLVNVHSVLKAKENLPEHTLPSESAEKDTPVLHPEDDLRSALSLLLSSGTDPLKVVNSSGKLVGEVGFTDLRDMLNSHQAIEKNTCNDLSD
jgi:osmoprotectant transport system ATP-binding protein